MGMLFEEWGTMNPAIEQTIRQIMECRYIGGLEESFVLSKSLDLLVLSIEAARATPGQYLKTEADRSASSLRAITSTRA
jgi:AraC family transcriptional regulator, transcriptional activator of the genes for pyochelin and ferripyochelin receptors